MTISAARLSAVGVDDAAAASMARRAGALLADRPPAAAWQALCGEVLTPAVPFAAHRLLYEVVFADWDDAQGPPPVWTPSPARLQASNLCALMRDVGVDDYAQLRRWSVQNRARFWEVMIERIDVRMARAPRTVLDLAEGPAAPRWLAGARLNITDTCFQAPPDQVAIVHRREGDDGAPAAMTYGELEALVNRVANGACDAGLRPGDPVAVCMPMTAASVALYLGLVRAGCVVVAIADSFASDEIARRITIGGARAAFTQDWTLRAGKRLPMYARLVEAGAPRTVVLPVGDDIAVALRPGDVTWHAFLSDRTVFESVIADPDDVTNIMFSSGTTGDPKAIPWSHLPPIKSAADAWLHHDVHRGDVLAWPTNLGWMMGPWLIYASLCNRAAMALFDGAPTGRPFGRFVQDARATMLGLVPSLVRAWRDSGCMEGLDWSAIATFSSTGECSDAEDMHYLMALAGYRPVIEYCGGTEIGGGYITGTVVQPSSPATFSTLALGLDVAILDDDGRPADEGELFLVPPSIGLSQALLNRDHHAVYHEGVPPGPGGQVLRRHGDHMRRLGGGYYRALGRVDDTMNLGGIKTSSAEIERVVNTLAGVSETAAIAVPPPGGGPALLVVYAVLVAGSQPGPDALKADVQAAIRARLNPLFRVHEVVPIAALPRTASNKVMRRALRAAYEAGRS